MTDASADEVAIFAISYDPVEVLRDFADEHGINYRLLSDQGSVVIERLGLLNRHVAAQQAHYGMPVAERHRGIPYPGTFMLDECGVITERRFEQSYRVRPAGTLLLEDLLGTTVGEQRVTASAEAVGLQVLAWLDTDTYRPQQNLRVRVVIEIDPGLHLYAPPTPEGFTPLSVELAPFDGLVSEPADLPPGEPFTMAGFDEEFTVYEGRLETTVPFRIEPNQGTVTLDVRVHHQACSDTVCHPPSELRLPLELQGRDVLRP